MILSTDFINTNSSLKFDSTYSTIWNCFTMWNCYMKMLGSGRFFSLMKTMQVLPTPKWIDSLLSTNHLQIPCLKHFQFLQRAYVDASVYLIELVEYHSIYSKNNQGFNRSLRNSSIYGPCFRKRIVQWYEKSCVCEVRIKPFCFIWKIDTLHFVKKSYDVRCQKQLNIN